MHLYKGLVLKYCLITRDARVGSSPGRVVGNSSPIGLPKGSGGLFLAAEWRRRPPGCILWTARIRTGLVLRLQGL